MFSMKKIINKIGLWLDKVMMIFQKTKTYKYIMFFLLIIIVALTVLDVYSIKKANKMKEDFYKTTIITIGDFVIEQERENSFNIIGLSEEGKTKKVVVLPEKIGGYFMYQCNSILIDSDNLTDFYFTGYADCSIDFSLSHNLVNKYYILYLRGNSSFEGNSYYPNRNRSYGIIESTKQYPGKYLIANVSYMYNYNMAENDGFYFIDNYSYGERIEYIPNNPTRYGNIFDGWYKEKECINKWYFENDTLPNPIYDEEGNVIYQETKLYAKWVRENE